DDPVRITLPKGAYLPIFEFREAPTEPAHPTRSIVYALGAVSFAALLLATGYLLHSRASSEQPERVKLIMAAPDGTTLHSIAISPDGAAVAIAAYKEGVSRLYVRRIDSFSATPIPASESAGFPFWSPDSRAIGFFAGGKLQIADLNG